MASRLAQALEEDEAVEVPMNKADFVSFVGDGKRAIGTRDLNSCTTVILASAQGAIMAHISPLPGFTTDPNASINHTRTIMHDFLEIYHRRELEFKFGEATKTPVIVYALFVGQVAMPTQRKFIHDILLENLENNHMPKEYSYDVSVGGHVTPAGGTVFIDGRDGLPKLYVEDEEKPLL
ncbi:hypothetical protein FQN54_000108 [Arachnomyces sp. PD_36]|nr:hypothetical protein FQN54_000108 [Arachnomyces sp. PD_36]